MTTIVTRAGKGSPLTNNEVDANFVNLNTAKIETLTSTDSSVTITGTGDSRDLSVPINPNAVSGPASSTDNAITRFDGTTGKLVQNSTVTIDDNGNVESVNAVSFDLTPGTLPTAPGSLYWDSANGNQTLSLIMANGDATQQIGEEMYFRIKASAPITEGQVVMFTGTVGASGALTGAPASGLTAATASYVMGIATHTLATNDWGYITNFGLVRQINTNAWPAGTILYYDPTVAGGLTDTIPAAPNAKVQVCAVIYQSSSVGSLFVRPSFGGILGQYEGDVGLGAYADGQLLVRNQTDGKWVNANLTAGTAISITNGAGSVTVTNTAPDQVVALTGAGTTTVTGTYPNFTITSTDSAAGTVTNVSATAPISVANGSTTPSITITQAGAAADGYLSSTDWNTFNDKYDIPTQTGNTGKYLTTDGSVTSWGAVDALPPQTGENGKFLTTDGTDASWATVDALPTQTGNAGKFLTTDGSVASWEDVGGGTVDTFDFTATAGQTVITVNYTVGATSVYQNGVKLGAADFTATNGTSITLGTAAAAGDLLEVVTFSNLNLYSVITEESFSGNGTTTGFTMSAVPANAASALIVISGVTQDPSSYTVSGNTLTFSTAPPTGTDNISVRYLGVAAAGVVSSFSGGTTGLTPASATTGAVTLGGTLATTNGGTGLTTVGTNGQVLSSNGTSLTWSTPATTSPGGSTTQIQYNNAGAFGGSANFVFDGTNVGIGTSSPSEKLHVAGSVASSGVFIPLNSTTAIGYIGNSNPITGGSATNIGLRAESAMLFATGGATERMRIDSSGNVKLSTAGTSILNSSGRPILNQTGSVLRISQTVWTNAFSQATSDWTNISTFTASITPLSTSSNIVIQVMIGCDDSSTNGMDYRILRNGSVMPGSIGDAAGVRDRVMVRKMGESDGNHNRAVPHMIFLDSPASTSAVTYQIQVKLENNGTYYFNRCQVDTDIANAYGGRSISSIIFWEIAG